MAHATARLGRKMGREIMIDKLYAGGLRLETKVHGNGGLVCIVVWGGLRVERAVYGQARNAARNAWVGLLAHVLRERGRWPVAARPRSDPQSL